MVMPQSQDIHLNDSKKHRGQTTRIAAGKGKHLDVCIYRKTCTCQAHASLAQEMHAPKPLLGACITCVPQLKVYRHSNCTLINHYSIQMLQSAQVKTPCTE